MEKFEVFIKALKKPTGREAAYVVQAAEDLSSTTEIGHSPKTTPRWIYENCNVSIPLFDDGVHCSVTGVAH